jgi:hypothetical protein
MGLQNATCMPVTNRSHGTPVVAAVAVWGPLPMERAIRLQNKSASR